MGDNADAFDDDPTETTDSDSDGVGDNADAFDDDPTETMIPTVMVSETTRLGA